MSDYIWNAGLFFSAAAEQFLSTHEVVAYRRFMQFFQGRGNPITWANRRNSRGGFQIGFAGVLREPIVYGYIDGTLTVYPKKLRLDIPKQHGLRLALSDALRSKFDVNVDNKRH